MNDNVLILSLAGCSRQGLLWVSARSWSVAHSLSVRGRREKHTIPCEVNWNRNLVLSRTGRKFLKKIVLFKSSLCVSALGHRNVCRLIFLSPDNNQLAQLLEAYQATRDAKAGQKRAVIEKNAFEEAKEYWELCTTISIRMIGER